MPEPVSQAGRLALRPAAAPAGGLLRSARTLAACLFAGAVAGLLVGGLGGRLVMRILAVAEDGNRRITTDAGFVSGTFSLSGTVELVGFVTVFTGFAGGVRYVLVRRWLPSKMRWRIPAWGLLLLLFSRGFPIDDSFDFRVFGPAGLAVALFGLFPFLYAAVQVPLAERLDRSVPAFFRRRVVTALGLAGIGALAISGAVTIARNLAAIL